MDRQATLPDPETGRVQVLPGYCFALRLFMHSTLKLKRLALQKEPNN
jgi:hypothetical protein